MSAISTAMKVVNTSQQYTKLSRHIVELQIIYEPNQLQSNVPLTRGPSAIAESLVNRQVVVVIGYNSSWNTTL